MCSGSATLMNNDDESLRQVRCDPCELVLLRRWEEKARDRQLAEEEKARDRELTLKLEKLKLEQALTLERQRIARAKLMPLIGWKHQQPLLEELCCWLMRPPIMAAASRKLIGQSLTLNRM